MKARQRRALAICGGAGLGLFALTNLIALVTVH